MSPLRPTALWVALTIALMAAVPSTAAYAGRTCEERAPDALSVQRGLDLALSTARALDASGAEVVMLARAGQDLSRYRLRWSHMGYAYREASEAGGSVWRVVHKLNRCGSAEADLYRQGLGEFFLDDPHEYAAAVMVLAPDLQARLLPLLRSNAEVTRLHTAAYSMVAYPWARHYQQSNQWVIETLALAQEASATTRVRAQAWLRFKGYEPTALRISPLMRLGARMTAANVSFDDHPNAKRYADRIETVTVDSVFDWLPRVGMAQQPQVLR